MDIHEIINRIYRMPEASADKVVKHLSKITYPKGYHISFSSRKGLLELTFP